ncbi:sugar phosphate isomerase/epimerase [Isoptericola sp. NEAU-Y5]|uniref:Sugar phosphate isomerase/epimerase n=1 Tax=Isoptericola luteus TaxID=2879484 RepID=A0ABS7ZAC0_9MICO|nr:sugar phosphate isomerase/epimerase family protein [Isoptericola sp. NEAU-Y5]MCA5892004.1 sugar phosphate isomerase/epimerase [Isoptericola sp. NEAU-Y5]
MPETTIPVSLSTASVYPRRAAFAFEAAAELGYDGVEIMVWSDDATQDPAALTRLAADHGVPVRSIHAPTLLVSQRVWGRAPASKLRRSVEMAGELGASTVVVHPPFRWQYKYARQFQELVHELNESGDVTIAVENMYPWRPRSKGERELKAYLPGWDPADHDYDAVTLDLSHAAVAQQDGLELVAGFGDRLRHVHLADGTSSARDEHLVPGRGDMGCDKVLEELSRRGYAGDVVVEITTRKARTAHERHADLEASLRFARAHLAPVPEPYTPPAPEHRHRPADAWE